MPLASPLPSTLPQNGTTEATSTSIQLEIVQENKNKAHSRELPLVLVIVELTKHYLFRGDYVRSQSEKGEGLESQHPLAVMAFHAYQRELTETHKQQTQSLPRLHANIHHRLEHHDNLHITYLSLAHFIKCELSF